MVSTEQSILKMMGSEAIQRAREEAVERLGPSSLDHTARPPLRHLQLDSYSESRFDRYLRSFAGTIAGGTSEIPRNLVTARVLGQPRRPRQPQHATPRHSKK